MIKTSFNHSIQFIMHLIGVALLIGVLALSVLAGFLSQGPINLERLIPFIEREVNNSLKNDTVKINDLYLEWQGHENPLGLEAKGITISNQQGPFLFAPEIDLNISLRSLLLGKVRIEDLWVRELALSVTRNQDGQIQITGAHKNKDEENKTATDYNAIPNIVTLSELIHELPPFESFWLDKTRIIYRDLVKEQTQHFDPVTVFMSMDESDENRVLSGYMSFPFGQSGAQDIIKMNFKTQSDPLVLSLHADIKSVAIDHVIQFLPKLPTDVDINMVVDGKIQAQLDNLWALQNLNIDMTAPQGHIYYQDGDQDKTIEASDVALTIFTNPVTDELQIKDAFFRMNDTALISFEGNLKNLNQADLLMGEVGLTVKNLPQSWFNQYWPVGHEARNNGAYRWLAENMADGVFDQIMIKTAFDRAKKSRADNVDLPPWLTYIKADFSYHDMTIDYNAPMAKAKKTKGTGAYKDIALSLNIEEANIGGLSVQNATLDFDDLISSGKGNAILKFPITGELQKVFDYIATQPISAFDNVDFQPKNTKGTANLIADIKFPLAKDTPLEEFDIVVTGTANDVDVKNAVKNLTLSGGPYDIRATINDIALKGSGELSGEPITLDWHEYFSTDSAKGHDYLSKINATVTANQTIRKSFMQDFSKYFKGKTTVNLSYLKDPNDRTSKIALDLDLTQTQLQAKSLGLLKPIGQKSSATLDVHLKNGDLASIKNLAVKGRGASLGSGQIDFVTHKGEPLIQKGTLKKFLFDENKISVDLGGDKDLLKINVTGAFLDARPILEGQKDEVSKTSSHTGRPFEIGVDVIEMRTSDEATLTDVEIYTKQNKSGQAERFEMNAKAGRGDLYVRYNPDQDGQLSLQVESNNAGDTLRAFDLYPNIQDGTLRIAGVPLEGGRFGDVRGKARIDNFRVSDAPILVRLFNALSFKDGGKLNFKRLESDFEWRIGDNGDIYKISDGTTSGASIGLTFDGYIDTSKDEINIKGTAAPLEGINNIVGNIPLIGNILTGGEALVAATYTVKGTTSDPNINVNPLSVLTPGIIRKMLFENSTPEPEDDKVKKESKPRGLN